MSKINITLYRWAGQWGPFKVNIPCGECSLTTDIIKDALANELSHIDIEFKAYDWLSHWWQPLTKGGWHAPIVLVNGKIISQGQALNRSLLVQSVVEAYAKTSDIKGTHIFGKQSCLHCSNAKELFEQHNISYQYHDVIKAPNALYEMLARVKPIVGPKTPITVPQIWIEGQYIGGAKDLAEHFNRSRHE